MSNVHTLNDLNNDQNQSNAAGPAYSRVGQQQSVMGMGPQDEESKAAAGMYGGLTGGGGNIGKTPREENYWDMWKSTFCPQFTIVSFTFMIWVLNTICYIGTLIMTWVKSDRDLNYYVFLGPDLRVLHTWGALDAYEIRYNYQIWRLFTSLLLSTGFSTYCISSGALMVLGFMVENPKMSASRMAVFYFTCGILGNLFSVCVQNEVSVGSMTSVIALVSGLLSSVIVNWKALQGAGYMRVCLIFMMIMLMVVILLLSVQDNAGYNWESISIAGEGGGFMAGIFVGMVLMPPALQRNDHHVKLIRMIGLGSVIVYAAILIPVFFCAVEPYQTRWARDDIY